MYASWARRSASYERDVAAALRGAVRARRALHRRHRAAAVAAVLPRRAHARRCRRARSTRCCASKRLAKPLVIAVQGWCLTIGIELLLAADIRVAADDTRFAQIEVKRGIYPDRRCHRAPGAGAGLGQCHAHPADRRRVLRRRRAAPGAWCRRWCRTASSSSGRWRSRRPSRANRRSACARRWPPRGWRAQDGERAAFARMLPDLQQAMAQRRCGRRA